MFLCFIQLPLAMFDKHTQLSPCISLLVLCGQVLVVVERATGKLLEASSISSRANPRQVQGGHAAGQDWDN